MLCFQTVVSCTRCKRYLFHLIIAMWLHARVTVDSVQPGSCGNVSLAGGQSNFTYCQKFQWSSSALVDLISVDQLLILDNVLSYSVFHVTEHRKYIYFPLHVDTPPCVSTKDEILAALMQLLLWVCAWRYLHACAWVITQIVSCTAIQQYIYIFEFAQNCFALCNCNCSY